MLIHSCDTIPKVGSLCIQVKPLPAFDITKSKRSLKRNTIVRLEKRQRQTELDVDRHGKNRGAEAKINKNSIEIESERKLMEEAKKIIDVFNNSPLLGDNNKNMKEKSKTEKKSKKQKTKTRKKEKKKKKSSKPLNSKKKKRPDVPKNLFEKRIKEDKPEKKEKKTKKKITNEKPKKKEEEIFQKNKEFQQEKEAN